MAGRNPGWLATPAVFVVAIALICSLSACGGREEQRTPVELAGVKEIHVDYQHTGWGSVEEHFIITPAAPEDGFILRARYVTKSGVPDEVDMPLSSEAVGVFLQALQAPAWPRRRGVQALARKIDRAALRRVEPPNTIPASRCTKSELKQLAGMHITQKGVTALVDDRYGHGISWTDDYPHALVQVRWHDRPDFVMSSSSQKAMLLPWKIGEPSASPPEPGENWSLPVSTTLRDLLPPASHLHDRLDGMLRLQDQLGFGVMLEAERQCRVMRRR